jgi:hypothetical protein
LVNKAYASGAAALHVNNIYPTLLDTVRFERSGSVIYKITGDGVVHLRAGTSTTLARAGGILKEFYTDESTTSVTEDPLYTYSVPANALSTNGDKIEFEFTADVTGGDDIRVNFDGQVVYAQNVNGASGGSGNYVVKGYIIRTGSSTARAYAVWHVDYVAFSPQDVLISDLTGIDFTAAIDLVFAAVTGGTTGTTAKTGIIKWEPAGN